MATISCHAQYKELSVVDKFHITPELQFGLTLPSNSNFPSRKIQKSLQINISKKHYTSSKKWTSLLNYPTTGIAVSFTDFGNVDKLGKAISLSPFIEYNFKKQKLSRLYLKTGLGISYINKLYDSQTNAYNRAVLTHYNVHYYLLMNYKLMLNKRFPVKIGGGYLHHSNAHSKLPNMGLNSAIISLSSNIYFSENNKNIDKNSTLVPKTYQTYFEFKNGMGYHDFLSENHAKKNIWVYSISGGTIYKDTYKIGFGLSYRKYQHYYDYIVEKQIDEFIENPNLNASNLFVYLHTEIMMDHVSLNIDGGLNLFKPFYKTHYLIEENQLDFSYELKKLFLGRMGLKLYMNNTHNLPTNNLFIGAHINSTLSQADFFEFSVGFVHRLPLKKWKWNGTNTR